MDIWLKWYWHRMTRVFFRFYYGIILNQADNRHAIRSFALFLCPSQCVGLEPLPSLLCMRTHLGNGKSPVLNITPWIINWICTCIDLNVIEWLRFSHIFQLLVVATDAVRHSSTSYHIIYVSNNWYARLILNTCIIVCEPNERQSWRQWDAKLKREREKKQNAFDIDNYFNN